MPTIKKQKHILAPGYIIYATCSRTGKLCFIGQDDSMTWKQTEAQVFDFPDLARATAFRLEYKLGMKTDICFNSEFLPTEIVKVSKLDTFTQQRISYLVQIDKAGHSGWYIGKEVKGTKLTNLTRDFHSDRCTVSLVKGNRAKYRTKRPPVWPSIHDNPKQLF